MAYYFEQSELEIGKRRTLIGTFLILAVFVFAYFFPDDVSIFGKVLVIGVSLFIACCYFLTGVHLLRKKHSGIWRICIDDKYFDLQYPTGSRFKCELSDIKRCIVVRQHSSDESASRNRYSLFLIFSDSRYRLIKAAAFDIDYGRVLEELEKHTVIEFKVVKGSYESVLRYQGYGRKGLIKAHWK